MLETEVTSDGKTVWVNHITGMCLGRFSRFGIDIHKDFAGQMAVGQCLDCKMGPTTEDDWNHFIAGMKNHYGVVIAKKHRPKFI